MSNSVGELAKSHPEGIVPMLICKPWCLTGSEDAHAVCRASGQTPHHGRIEGLETFYDAINQSFDPERITAHG